jgi:excinuclease ABC subunit A
MPATARAGKSPAQLDVNGAAPANTITVRGAREHNLKNISVELPRDRLIVFTGLSGSGKSSLAFDTIYAEGQRRYVESLSAYARQFLGQMDKPDVDVIEGLSPAISIDQKSGARTRGRRSERSPRSTTTCAFSTRASASSTARPTASDCSVRRRSRSSTASSCCPTAPGSRCSRRSCAGRKGEYESLLEDLAGQGFVRARVDGELVDIAEFLRREDKLARYEQHTIEVVVDRLVRREGIERRLTDSLETALKLAEGVAEVELVPRDGDEQSETLTFSQHLVCPTCGKSYEELAPRNFSFNSPYGACDACDGLGTTFEVDPELVIPDPDLSIDGGAIAPWRSSHTQYFTRMLEAVATAYAIDLKAPYRTLTGKQQKVILHGVQGNLMVKYKNRYGRTREYSTSYEV